MKDRQQEKDFNKFDVNSQELGRMTLSATSRIEALKLFGLVALHGGFVKSVGQNGYKVELR